MLIHSNRLSPHDTPLVVHFFRTEAGHEPVRRWLKELEVAERKAIGEEIKVVQIGWPLGMPVVRKLGRGLWEIRVHLPMRIARVFFTVAGTTLVLLHGFIKQSQATPQDDLDLARTRLRQLKNG
ncbi:Phage-related protein [Paraburkholderia tropica]|uniref:type II toxin-antitoxin system RelE/ParE family toxin n=1 Tax=Paraburkholderia tropica TaxID=92647 RepID=UPI001CAB725F|nr:type II toxin-antitoxin system RelE/ParE family toxin [Paraburkholderia tropica]CAG9211234.1 Phage-related protein [Paraburkholderia tropica]